MYHLPYLGEGNEVESASTKCTTCKETTEQEYAKIIPVPEDPVEINVMDLLEKAKRLIICTKCGTLRLTN